jgi:hypothetical protein
MYCGLLRKKKNFSEDNIIANLSSTLYLLCSLVRVLAKNNNNNNNNNKHKQKNKQVKTLFDIVLCVQNLMPDLAARVGKSTL